MKFDVQNFSQVFIHMHYHGRFWGETIGEKLRTVSSAFGNATDVICQRINFNETNGIVVGPEFSRVMAELLMTRIDIKVQEALLEQKLVLKRIIFYIGIWMTFCIYT